TFHVVCFVQFSKNYLVAHLRLPYVNIFIFQCQLSFFISFVACDVIVIGDLSYITPLYNNSQ
ncbi:hypothetical protein PDQ31_28450, partial [Bacillus cereus]|nr:hypothetical protein [Bacillus cereus]